MLTGWLRCLHILFFFSGESTGRKTTLGHNVGDWVEQLEDARSILQVNSLFFSFTI